MKRRTWIALLLLAALLLTACGESAEQSTEPSAEQTPQPVEETQQEEPAVSAPVETKEELSVLKVENLPEDFILGMDVSSLIAEEQSGVRYYDFDGQEKDLLQILAENGVTHIRVRVWNDPYDAQGRGYGGGNCDIENALQIGQRATQFGMKLIVDFHYSDFWADPAKQKAPKAWAEMTLAQKEQAVYDFTYNSLVEIRSAGGNVGMVQIGNETTSGIAGETGNANMARIFKSGSSAVRQFSRSALVALHFTDPQNKDAMVWFADYLNEYNVDYDVFAVSYYPYWHGSLSNLTNVLDYAATKYNKFGMVAETSYANDLRDTDGHPNTVSEWNNNTGENLLWEFTPQGQDEEVRAVMNAVNNVSNGKGLGVFYWEGAWISVGDTRRLGGSAYDERVAQNKLLWERYGSGWASSYSAEYDPDDAGIYYGGCAVENQAFFDPQGKVLPSLSVFKKVRGRALGDVNNDGLITVADATLVQQHAAEMIELTGDALAAADTNRDGFITVADATLIQRYAAEMIDGF